MDGHPYPDGDGLNIIYLGRSVGRWGRGTSLAVDFVGFNENIWIDFLGHHPDTDALDAVAVLTPEHGRAALQRFDRQSLPPIA